MVASEAGPASRRRAASALERATPEGWHPLAARLRQAEKRISALERLGSSATTSTLPSRRKETCSASTLEATKSKGRLAGLEAQLGHREKDARDEVAEAKEDGEQKLRENEAQRRDFEEQLSRLRCEVALSAASLQDCENSRSLMAGQIADLESQLKRQEKEIEAKARQLEAQLTERKAAVRSEADAKSRFAALEARIQESDDMLAFSKEESEQRLKVSEGCIHELAVRLEHADAALALALAKGEQQMQASTERNQELGAEIARLQQELDLARPQSTSSRSAVHSSTRRGAAPAAAVAVAGRAGEREDLGQEVADGTSSSEGMEDRMRRAQQPRELQPSAAQQAVRLAQQHGHASRPVRSFLRGLGDREWWIAKQALEPFRQTESSDEA